MPRHWIRFPVRTSEVGYLADSVNDSHEAADLPTSVRSMTFAVRRLSAVRNHDQVSKWTCILYHAPCASGLSRRKWAAPRAELARPSRSRAMSMSPVPAAMASRG